MRDQDIDALFSDLKEWRNEMRQEHDHNTALLAELRAAIRTDIKTLVQLLNQADGSAIRTKKPALRIIQRESN